MRPKNDHPQLSSYHSLLLSKASSKLPLHHHQNHYSSKTTRCSTRGTKTLGTHETRMPSLATAIQRGEGRWWCERLGLGGVAGELTPHLDRRLWIPTLDWRDCTGLARLHWTGKTLGMRGGLCCASGWVERR